MIFFGKKNEITELEKTLDSLQKDRVAAEKRLRNKLKEIEEALLYIKAKGISKYEIMGIIDTLLEEVYGYESDQQ